jgi:hypothetical protein
MSRWSISGQEFNIANLGTCLFMARLRHAGVVGRCPLIGADRAVKTALLTQLGSGVRVAAVETMMINAAGEMPASTAVAAHTAIAKA